MMGPVSRETVRDFMLTIAAQAKAALAGVKNPGYLQMSRLHRTSEKLVPSRYRLDDVERMISEAIAAWEAGYNVYIEGRTIREDSARGNGHGKLEDTAAVFALVVDSDNDTGKGWKPTVPVSLTVETSPGNAQCWLFFKEALDPAVGKRLGERLRAAAGADHDTGTITQPYRVAGTANYPSKTKCEHGRITVQTQIVDFDPEALWTQERFEEAFPPPTSAGKGGANAPRGGARTRRGHPPPPIPCGSFATALAPAPAAATARKLSGTSCWRSNASASPSMGTSICSNATRTASPRSTRADCA